MARKLLVKIVNALTAMMEIGGPQACAYLLGHPDRYTDQTFKVFYWHSYCRKVLSDVANVLDIDVDADLDLPDNDHILLGRSPDGVVERSKVDDYVFRPSEFASWSLYDYLRFTDIRKLRQRDHFPTEPETVDLSNSHLAHVYAFQPTHPLHASHGVFLRKTSKPYILNFAGGTLPRHDKGDRETYCSTMLTFFVPWRIGTDLRDGHESWEAAFVARTFTVEELQVMKNMNVLYECLDARDDYSAQRRTEGVCDSPSIHPRPAVAPSECHFEPAEPGMEGEGSSCESLLSDDDLGKKYAAQQNLMEQMATMIRNDNLSSSPTAVPNSTDGCILDRPSLSPSAWKEVVSTAKKQAIENMTNCQPSTTSSTTPNEERSLRDRLLEPLGKNARNVPPLVSVLTLAHLNRLRSYGLDVSDRLDDNQVVLLHNTIDAYSLNDEQARAFGIIAKQLMKTSDSGTVNQLLMHLGGMAGTGKSRVLLAIMGFLTACGETGRFIVLGPTGSSAALIGGSTYHSVLGFMRPTE
ncbi:hypothetical protein LXA43DRAFT_877071, partial [Ganoderma leucocontextum]